MVLLLAFSLQDQVEKYGAYVGIAAFFGLAVLTLLYFSQARELRRLRDWAGRAPERAQELEARVSANAQAARTVQAVPRTVGPATAAGAAAAAAAAPATQVIEAPEGEQAAVTTAAPGAVAAAASGDGKAATPAGESADGATPVGASPATGDADPGAATPEGATAESGDATPGDAAPVGATAAPGAAAAGTAAQVGARAASGDAESGAATPEDAATPGPDGAPQGDAAPGAAAPVGAGAASGDAATADDEGDEDEPDEDEAAPPAVAPVPRATPVPRRTPVPAAPLRQPSRSATLPPRRPAPSPPRGGNGGNGRDAGRRGWLLPAGLAVVILAAVAFGATQLLGGGDEASTPTAPTGQAAETPTAGSTSDDATGSRLTPATTKVAVLNGTTIEGLASEQADILRAAGFTEITTGNNTEQRVESTVLYGDGARAMAREVARRLDIASVQPLDPDTRALGENADVVVILGQDKAP
jgi:hypothetical protein